MIKTCLIKKELDKVKMHRPGIEPGSTAWKAIILPLNHRCLTNTKAFFINLQAYDISSYM